MAAAQAKLDPLFSALSTLTHLGLDVNTAGAQVSRVCLRVCALAAWPACCSPIYPEVFPVLATLVAVA